MIAFLREQSLQDDLMAPREITYERQIVNNNTGRRIVDRCTVSQIHHLDSLSLIDNFTWSHEIIMKALLSEESNHQCVDIDDPNDALKILCGSKAERKRRKEVWFDYRDQKIFNRKISATKYSDLVVLTEGNDLHKYL